MKLLIAGAVLAHLISFLPPAVSQDNPSLAARLNLTIGRSNLQADNINRGLHYPSVVELKGNVQIIVKIVAQHNPLSLLIMEVRADEVDYHEDTGEIEARGNVRVRYRDDPGNTKNGNVRIKLENRTDILQSK